MFKNSLLILIVFVVTSCSYYYLNINQCKSFGTIELICDLQNPEDFAKIPHEDSLVVSQFAGLPELNEGRVLNGKLSKLNLDSRKVEDFEIEILENNNLGIGQEDCKPFKDLYPHGIDIFDNFSADAKNASPFLEEASLLAVVNHQEISSVEFFLVFPEFVNFSDRSKPTLIWVGCVNAPKKNTYFNDVVVYDSKGSFFATHQYDKDKSFFDLLVLNFLRFNSGYVYQWNYKNDFSIVPNSGGAWPNGIEMIGEDLYVNYRINGMISKFSGGKRKDFILRTYLKGGPDNVIAVGNNLWIAGQNTDLGAIQCINEAVIQCPMPFFVIKADKSLNILEEYNFEDVSYGGASVAYPFKDEVFIGAYKSDRIGIFKR